MAWEWTLSVPDPGAGLVHVELRVRGLDALTDELRLDVTRALDARALPGTDARREGAWLLVAVDDAEEGVAYDVLAREPASGADAHVSHVGRDLALFRAELVALPYAYDSAAPAPLVEATARLVAPQGWSAAAPWEPLGATEYRLDPPSPQGYVAMGVFGADESRTIDGRAFRHVRLGNVTSFEPVLWEHLSRATPFLAATHGDAVGARVLVVSAPSPVPPEGRVARGSVVVHDGADVRTLAVAYARAWQEFETVDVAPTSALWLREGAAELFGALSLRASGQWSDARVNAYLDDARRHERDPSASGATLPQARAGGPLEPFARGKGAVVLRALDAELRARSAGAVDVADLLRALNEDARGPGAARIDNRPVQSAAESLVGESLAPFFDAYVYGPRWPDARPFVAEGLPHVSPLRFEPPVAAPGDAVVVSFDVVNRGVVATKAPLAVSVGERAVGSLPVALDVGENASLQFLFDAPPPGDAVVRVGPRGALFHSLSAPSLSIARVGATVAEPRAGEPFALLVYVGNAGERAGAARVEVHESGRLVQRTTEATIDAESTDALTLPLRFDTPGPRVLELTLVTDAGATVTTHELLVLEASDAPRETRAWTAGAFAALVLASFLSRAARAPPPRRP